jgi:long-chain acyl-CoA synthetase
MSEDGWLHTGDVGKLDEDGFLYVTDRKKEILVTSGGKNVSPQPIEQTLVSDPLIEQVMLVGEGRPYIAALVVPCSSALESWAAARGLDSSDRKGLLESEPVRRLYREIIDRRTTHLSRFETIKRFVLLGEELSQEAGELTPTLKVKRRVVRERYKAQIDRLYEQETPEPPCP